MAIVGGVLGAIIALLMLLLIVLLIRRRHRTRLASTEDTQPMQSVSEPVNNSCTLTY